MKIIMPLVLLGIIVLFILATYGRELREEKYREQEQTIKVLKHENELLKELLKEHILPLQEKFNNNEI